MPLVVDMDPISETGLQRPLSAYTGRGFQGKTSISKTADSIVITDVNSSSSDSSFRSVRSISSDDQGDWRLHLLSDEEGSSASIFSAKKNFSPSQIFFLCHLVTPDELEVRFLHSEGMANFFGIGVSCCKLRLRLGEDVIAEEIRADQWEHDWLNSEKGSFHLLLFEKKHKKNSPVQDVVDLTQQEALAQCGVVAVEVQRQEQKQSKGQMQYVKVDKLGLSYWPIWAIFIQAVTDLIQNTAGEENPESVVDFGEDPIQQVELGGEPESAIETQPEEVQKRKSLIVIVTLLAGGLYFIDSLGTTLPGPGDVSYIEPTITFEFLFEGQEKYVTVQIDCRFEMGVQDEEPWHKILQEALQLSFQSLESGGDRHSHLDSSQLLSKIIFNDIEFGTQSGIISTIQRELVPQGSMQGGVAAFNVSRRRMTSWQHNGGRHETSKIMRRMLADSPRFAVSDFSMTNQGKMTFGASYVGREFYSDRTSYLATKDVSSTGLESSVILSVRGKWHLWGTDSKFYKFFSKKKLSQQVEGKKQMWTAWTLLQALKRCLWFSGPESDGCERQSVRQIFTKEFILNHDFQQFFTTYSRVDPHLWTVSTEGNQGNPVPDAL